MIKKLIFTLLTTLFFSSIFAISPKDGYNINCTIRNNTDSLVYLCYYFGQGGTVQKVDSAKLEKGTTSFKWSSDKKIAGGIYMLLFASRTQQVEFILDNGADLKMNFDKNEMIKSIAFENNDIQNNRFYDDKRFLGSFDKKIADLNTRLASGKKKDTTYVNEQYVELNKSIIKYRDDLIAKEPKSTLSILYKSMKEPNVPSKLPLLKDGKTKDSTFPNRYYREHYWDDWNFQDDRLIYAPIYDNKLNNFFRAIPMAPDSFNAEADKLMKQVKCGSDMYRYTNWWLTRYAGNSKIMGMDESYVYMIEKYIMGPDYCGHLDSATKAAYIGDAQKIGPNTMGKKGRDIPLVDDKENPQTLWNTCTQGDFTVLEFFDPTCHHCEKEMPAMDSTLNEVEKKLGIKIMRFAVQNADEDEKWHKFIKDKKLDTHYVHVHNPSHYGNYRLDYNVLSNPVFYLLDKNAIILGKRIDHTNIGGLIEHLYNEEKKKK